MKSLSYTASFGKLQLKNEAASAAQRTTASTHFHDVAINRLASDSVHLVLSVAVAKDMVVTILPAALLYASGASNSTVSAPAAKSNPESNIAMPRLQMSISVVGRRPLKGICRL